MFSKYCKCKNLTHFYSTLLDHTLVNGQTKTEEGGKVLYTLYTIPLHKIEFSFDSSEFIQYK